MATEETNEKKEDTAHVLSSAPVRGSGESNPTWEARDFHGRFHQISLSNLRAVALVRYTAPEEGEDGNKPRIFGCFGCAIRLNNVVRAVTPRTLAATSVKEDVPAALLWREEDNKTRAVVRFYDAPEFTGAVEKQTPSGFWSIVEMGVDPYHPKKKRAAGQTGPALKNFQSMGRAIDQENWALVDSVSPWTLGAAPRFSEKAATAAQVWPSAWELFVESGKCLGGFSSSSIPFVTLPGYDTTLRVMLLEEHKFRQEASRRQPSFGNMVGRMATRATEEEIKKGLESLMAVMRQKQGAPPAP